MSTATRVPETSRITEDELDGSDARTALSRFGRRRLAVESFRRFRYGDGFSHSRAVGFQLVLALIPLTIAMAGLSSALHAEGIGLVIRDTLLSLTPGSSDEVVRETLDQGLEQARVGVLALWLGLGAALVALTTAMGQMERGANRIYGIQRDRPAGKKYSRALGLAVVAGIPLVLGFLVLVAGEQVIDAVADQFAVSEVLVAGSASAAVADRAGAGNGGHHRDLPVGSPSPAACGLVAGFRVRCRVDPLAGPDRPAGGLRAHLWLVRCGLWSADGGDGAPAVGVHDRHRAVPRAGLRRAARGCPRWDPHGRR